MFDFEKLTVYSKAKAFNLEITHLLRKINPDPPIRNQLRRSSLSIVLNIAEGAGRKTRADKRNFFVISRGSVFECVAILDVIKDEGLITHDIFLNFYSRLEELSRMLYEMTENLEKSKIM